jgi:hypothetical protein
VEEKNSSFMGVLIGFCTAVGPFVVALAGACAVAHAATVGLFDVVVVGMMMEFLMLGLLFVRSWRYLMALVLRLRALHPRVGRCENAARHPQM